MQAALVCADAKIIEGMFLRPGSVQVAMVYPGVSAGPDDRSGRRDRPIAGSDPASGAIPKNNDLDLVLVQFGNGKGGSPIKRICARLRRRAWRHSLAMARAALVASMVRCSA